jgi:repressor LexA
VKPKPIDDKISILSKFFRDNKRLPSYSEMAALFGFSSKNAVFRLVKRLEAEGYLEKDSHGRLAPLSSRFGLPLLGYVQAGFPSPAEEELVDTLSLDEYLVRNPSASFLLKVTGDSMIDAGIHQDDLTIIERGQTPKNGDIVLAEVDGDWTLKYLEKRGNSVKLVAANKNYPPIVAKQELKIAGIVKGVVRRY